MPQRALGTADTPPGANVAEYRVRERTVGGVLVGEQRLIFEDEMKINRRAAMSTLRINGGPTTETTLYSLANNAPLGSNVYAALRGLSVQVDATGANTNPNVAFKLYRDSLPSTVNTDGTTGLYGGNVLPGGGVSFDRADRPLRPAYADYQSLIAGTANLVAYFPLQEASGSIASTVGGFTGTAAGTPEYRREGPFGEDYAIRINASNEYFMVPMTTTLTEYTLEFFVRFNAVGQGVPLVNRANAWSGTGFHLGVRSNPDTAGSLAAQQPRLAFNQGDGTNVGGIANTKHIQPGEWHHVMIRKAAGTGWWLPVVDGVVGTGASTTGPAVQTGGNPQFNIGAVVFSGQTAPTGTIDYDIAHVSLYNRAMPVSECEAHYKAWAPYIESRFATPQDGYAAASMTANEIINTLPANSASARVVAHLTTMRAHTAVEQLRLEDFRLQASDQPPIILGPQEYAAVMTELPVAASHTVSYWYLVNSLFEEFTL